MRYTLSNDVLTIEVDSFGAELKSVKKGDKEFMWCGDKKYWGRTSPVLFPFVGSLKNKQFTYEGKTYPMGQHGFARDMEHCLIEQTDNKLVFELKSNEETLAKYPMPFVLKISYELVGNSVKVGWKVTNPSDKTLYFSIGAHPAFNCPMGDDESKEGYKVFFGNLDEVHWHNTNPACGLSVMDDRVLKLEDNMAEITPGFFDVYTYIIEGKQADTIGLVDKNGHMYVKVTFDMPLVALWSPEFKNAPFVCIEPWCGRCDAEGFEGELKDREYGNALEKDEVFEQSYAMYFD